MGKRALPLILVISILSAQVEAAMSSLGGRGLWRVLSADTEGRRALSLSLHTQFWTKKYEHSYGRNSHAELVSYLGLGYCPWENLGLDMGIPINSYRDTEPESHKEVGLGDLRLSLALSRSLGRLLKVGTCLYSTFPSGDEGATFSETGEPFTNGALQLGGKGMATADFADRGEVPPFRFHLNAGYHHDRAEAISTQKDLNDCLALGLGMELPTSYFTPFLELSREQHIYNDTMTASESPTRLTPGLRFTKSGFNFDLAVDLNLSRELPSGEKIEPYDWRLLFAAAWTRAPSKLPPPGSVAGKITDLETGQPLQARIYFPGRDVSEVESDPLTGSFFVNRLPASLFTIKVEKEGYEEVIAPLFVKGGKVSVRDFALRRAIRRAVVLGKVTDSFTGEPVRALVSFGKFEAECDSQGNFESSLPSGDYSVRVLSKGYYEREETLTVEAGEEVVYQFSLLRAEPMTAPGVAFEEGEATILSGSSPALERIAQLLSEAPQVKIEIQGHTDSRGSDSSNLRLSQRRADAVRTYLIRQAGIEEERVIAKGYGESVPIADNSTEEGRRKNRRIDLLALKE